MDMKNFWEKISKQWSAILVIIAIFTMGSSYANSMFKLNEQITSLTETVSELSDAVKDITNITTRVESLENQVASLQLENKERLKLTARMVLITLNYPKEIDVLPASKAIMKEACNDPAIRSALYEDVGTDKTISFCAYVNK